MKTIIISAEDVAAIVREVGLNAVMDEVIERLEAELISEGISMNRRMEILLEIRRRVQEIDELEVQVEELEHERRHARHRLHDLQASAL